MAIPEHKERLHLAEHCKAAARFTGAWEEYPVRNPLPENIRIARARNSHAARECTAHATE
jgi:hypothetical protein